MGIESKLYLRKIAPRRQEAIGRESMHRQPTKTQGKLMSKFVSPLLGVLLAAALAPTHVAAAPVKIVGFDDMSCNAWIKSRDDAELRGNYLAWARGALTGHNYANQSQQVSSISSGTVENFINRYCVEKPAGEISEAAFRMADKFSGRNQAITK